MRQQLIDKLKANQKLTWQEADLFNRLFSNTEKMELLSGYTWHTTQLFPEFWTRGHYVILDGVNWPNPTRLLVVMERH